MVAILGCIQDVEQAAQIVELAGGGAFAFAANIAPKPFDPKDERQLRDILADYLSTGREIIPNNDPGLDLYAQALTKSLELRSRFLEYAILRGASCLDSSDKGF